jgi:hypothetical protein
VVTAACAHALFSFHDFDTAALGARGVVASACCRHASLRGLRAETPAALDLGGPVQLQRSPSAAAVAVAGAAVTSSPAASASASASAPPVEVMLRIVSTYGASNVVGLTEVRPCERCGCSAAAALS